MKTFNLLFASVVIFASSFVSAKPNSTEYIRDYTFAADASYRGDDGTCVESALQVIKLGQQLIFSYSEKGSEVIELSSDQAAKFEKLTARAWGQQVVINMALNNGSKLQFRGESCGRLQCDSIRIRNSSGEVKVFEQPIHGLIKIGCEP